MMCYEKSIKIEVSHVILRGKCKMVEGTGLKTSSISRSLGVGRSDRSLPSGVNGEPMQGSQGFDHAISAFKVLRLCCKSDLSR
jgi:hypothetical protein